MSKRAKVFYDSLMLCEQIRHEYDGKRTLVGVYTSQNIGVPSFPFHAGFSLYAAGVIEEGGAFCGGLSVKDSNGEVLFAANAAETVQLAPGRFFQELSAIFDITSDTVLEISVLDNDEVITKIFYPVKQNPIGSTDLRGGSDGPR